MPADCEKRTTPFSALASLVKVQRADRHVLIQAGFVRAMEEHIIFAGASSDKFDICAAYYQAGGKARDIGSAVIFCDKTAKFPETPYEFVAIVKVPPALPFTVQIKWPQLSHEFIFDTPPARDLSNIENYICPEIIWSVLAHLGQFSNDWHQLLRALPYQAALRLPEAAQTEKHRVYYALMQDILCKFNAANWHGSIDGFDVKVVTGWAMRDGTADSQRIDVYLNGKCIRRAVNASLFRPDVKAAGFGSGMYGFSLPVPSSALDQDILAFSLRDPADGSVFAFRFYRFDPGEIDYEASVSITASTISINCSAIEQPNMYFQIDVFIDDVWYCNGHAGKKKLKFPNPSSCLAPGSHFLQIRYPNGLFSQKYSFETDFINAIEVYNANILERKICIAVLLADNSCISVEWLEELFRNTPEYALYIFVQSNSAQPFMPEVKLRLKEHNCQVIKVSGDNGYSGILETALAAADGNDIVLLSPCVSMPPRWLASLRITAHMAPDIATVAPIPEGFLKRFPPGAHDRVEDSAGREFFAASNFRKLGCGCPVAVKFGNFDCLYIRGEYLKEMGGLEPAPDVDETAGNFFKKSCNAGWLNLLDTNTYVIRKNAGHDALEHYLSDKVNALISRQDSSLLNGLRWQLYLASWRYRKAFHTGGQPFRLRVLHVLSTEAGGTPLFANDLMDGLQHQIQAYFLKCDTVNISLYDYNNGDNKLIFSHDLDEIVDQVSHISHEYNSVLASWLFALDIDIVHIQALIWHSLDIINVARNLGCKVVFNIHDYYTLSPNLNLVDDTGDFLGKNYVEQGSNYRTSLWSKPFPLEVPAYRRFWRKRFYRYLQQCDALAVPEINVKYIIIDGFKDFGRLNDNIFHIIPHGANYGKFYNLSVIENKDRRFRILIPGNINYNKGMGIVLALSAYDESHENIFEFHIAGDCSIPSDSRQIIKHGRYDYGNLAAVIDRIRPHAACFFSIWNEIWCYTLSEVWAAGVPAFALDFPTLAARMGEANAGWLIQAGDIPDIYNFMAATLRDERKMAAAKGNIVKWQNRQGASRQRQEMAGAYLGLYDSLLCQGNNHLASWLNGIAMRPVKKRKMSRLPVAYLHASGARPSKVRVVLEALHKVKEAGDDLDVITYGYEDWFKNYGIENKYSSFINSLDNNIEDLHLLLSEIAANADFAIFPCQECGDAKPLAGALACLGVASIGVKEDSPLGAGPALWLGEITGSREWQMTIAHAVKTLSTWQNGSTDNISYKEYNFASYLRFIDELRNKMAGPYAGSKLQNKVLQQNDKNTDK